MQAHHGEVATSLLFTESITVKSLFLSSMKVELLCNRRPGVLNLFVTEVHFYLKNFLSPFLAIFCELSNDLKKKIIA